MSCPKIFPDTSVNKKYIEHKTKRILTRQSSKIFPDTKYIMSTKKKKIQTQRPNIFLDSSVKKKNYEHKKKRILTAESSKIFLDTSVK